MFPYMAPIMFPYMATIKYPQHSPYCVYNLAHIKCPQYVLYNGMAPIRTPQTWSLRVPNMAPIDLRLSLWSCNEAADCIDELNALI